jgi:hypothetical protein
VKKILLIVIIGFITIVVIGFITIVVMEANYEPVKKNNPVEERNKLLYSCIKDNRETSIKLKNTECEAYADGKAVDIGDNSSVNSGMILKEKKN